MLWKLAWIVFVGLTLGGSYYFFHVGENVRLLYLGAGAVAMFLSVLLGKVTGLDSEESNLTGLVALPGVVLVSVAELTAGDAAVVSVALGGGFGGLVTLLLVRFR